jgi:hypothetical protein
MWILIVYISLWLIIKNMPTPIEINYYSYETMANWFSFSSSMVTTINLSLKKYSDKR